MGQDYSYSQPLSSDEYDITALIQGEVELYGDEAESNYHIAEPLQYEPQPECDEGIPTTCYCGGGPVVAISSTAKDPERRYFTCPNEMRELQTQIRQLKDQGFECEEKVVKLQKTVCVLSKKKPRLITNGFAIQSQSSVDLDSPEPFWFGSQGPEEPVVEPVIESGVESGGKERRKWSLKEDKILIGAWLNTSKDAVVSNEQKSGQFWKRIVAYYNASPQLVGTKPRELGQCKQRGGGARINEQVSKFVGSYDAALREQRSGQNDDDVMKAAPDYFYNDHDYKFSLEHGWRELRHDQKWCSTYLSNHGGMEKRKQVLEVDTEDEVGEPEARPVGVKAAKAASKRKKSGKEEDLSQIQSIMAVKEKLSKQKLLERLLGKKEPLTEMETSLKLKLMSEMLGSFVTRLLS
ncbi:hypothetical protein YC2023_110112 [Brassica napus]